MSSAAGTATPGVPLAGGSAGSSAGAVVAAGAGSATGSSEDPPHPATRAAASTVAAIARRPNMVRHATGGSRFDPVTPTAFRERSSLACAGVKTRTLLLLALACGVAIMLAGAVFLFQLATQDELAEPVPIGEPVEVGDMTVIVESAVETGGFLDVSVRIGGVADPDGALGFRLIASGRPVRPDLAARGGSCGATTPSVVECLVRFDTSVADGESRVLFYERGDESARWVLS